MILDIVFAIVIILAIIRGYQRGLIIGIFSFVAIIVGLAAAIKLSAVAAGYIGSAVKISGQWLPVVSFIVVFLIVVLLIRWGANAIESTVEVVMLGWLNKIGGILLYVIIYTIVFSIILFYAEQVKLIQPETIQQSVMYSYIQPWGPEVIDGFGKIIPVFKDMFTELENFFGAVSKDIPPR
ncbi:MAG: CvpA family protein [Chitinophagales bacterium]|nr:CvpA family protein [Chitinophagales bacterium]